jgi:acyl-CoA thioesterase
MERVLEHFRQKDQFAKLCGIELCEVSKGYAKAQVRIGEEHLNGVRTAHGGLIFTLADLAFAAACNSCRMVSVAVNVSMNFIKPGKFGTVLTAEAREICGSRKMSSYEAVVKNEDGEIIASFTGLAYKKGDTIPGIDM